MTIVGPTVEKVAQSEARAALERIRDDLALSDLELADMFQTTQSNIHQYLQVKSPLPRGLAIQVKDSLQWLAKLELLIERDRVAQVIRRPSPLFSDRSAVELIAEGRIAYVVDAYDRLLNFAP